MHNAQHTEVYDVPIETLYDVIVDYRAYPDFVEHMTHTRVLKNDEECTRVKFRVEFMRQVEYTLDFYHEYPHRVEWELVRGDMFRHLAGAWELRERGDGHTEATYHLEVAPRFSAPGFIVRRFIAQNLPHLMNAFYEQALLRENGA